MKKMSNFRRIVRNSVRLYFAPLTGAFKAVRSEINRINREQHKETGGQNARHVC